MPNRHGPDSSASFTQGKKSHSLPDENFRSGVKDIVEDAERGEESWVEVLQEPGAPPELYPKGPKGKSTGRVSTLTTGIIFEPEVVLREWGRLSYQAFWYTLIGVDMCGRYVPKQLILEEGDRLNRNPKSDVETATRKWLLTSGCMENGVLNERWLIIRKTLSCATRALPVKQRRLLSLIKRFKKLEEVKDEFGSAFTRVWSSIRHKNWVTLEGRGPNGRCSLTDMGLLVLSSGVYEINYDSKKKSS